MVGLNQASPAPGRSHIPYHAIGTTQDTSFTRNTPVHLPTPAQANIDVQAGKKLHSNMASPEANNDASSPVLYELWRFTPKINPDDSIKWSLPKRKFIPSDQRTLEDLIDSAESEFSVEEQYQSLSKKIQAVIDDLVFEHNHRDARYEWTYVYIKSDRRKYRTPMFSVGERDVTAKMDVIISRKLRQRTVPAAPAFTSDAWDHARPRNPGNSNGVMAGNNTGRSREQVTSNLIANPAILPEHAPMHGSGLSPGHLQNPRQEHPQAPPQGHSQTLPQGHSQTLPQGHSQTLPQGHSQALPQGHSRAPPQVQSQAFPRGHSPAHFGGPHQVYQQGQAQPQHPMPPHSNLSVPDFSHNHLAGQSGTNTGPGIGQIMQQTPHQPVINTQMGGKIDHKAASFVPITNEPRQPVQNVRVPTNIKKTHGKQVHRESSHRSLQSHHAPREMAAARPPKVVQQHGEALRSRRVAYVPDDNSSMTEDESLFEEDGYSSSSSSSSLNSAPKGSLHRQSKYPEQSLSDRVYHVVEHKRGSQGRVHTSYPASTVHSFPSARDLRLRENKRAGDLSRHAHSGSIHDYQMSGRPPFFLDLEETSSRLRKVQEQQDSIIDKLNRLELQSHRSHRLDHVGNELTLRGLEADMRGLSRPVIYQDPYPLYRRGLRFAPPETMSYIQDPYY